MTAPGPGDQLASDDELLRRYRDHSDPAAMDEIVRRYLSFARGLAMRYRRGTEMAEDLVQVASLGLVHAIERFDPDRGTSFKAFAAPTILGELKRHFRDRVGNLRVPRGLQERILQLDEATKKLTGKLGRPPTVGELADRLELEETEVLEAFEAAESRRTLSLDQPVTVAGTEDEATVGEQVGRPDPGYEASEEWATVQEGLSSVSEREMTVLRLRFVEDLTQSQIAERIGVSQVHVSRILRHALQRVREEIDD